MSDQSVLQSFCIVFTFQIGLLIVNKDGSMQFEDISFQTNGNFLQIFLNIMQILAKKQYSIPEY